ncbi:hypothetical protein BROUX41_004978 [Berkeleyomyces rouxiae]
MSNSLDAQTAAPDAIPTGSIEHYLSPSGSEEATSRSSSLNRDVQRSAGHLAAQASQLSDHLSSSELGRCGGEENTLHNESESSTGQAATTSYPSLQPNESNSVQQVLETPQLMTENATRGPAPDHDSLVVPLSSPVDSSAESPSLASPSNELANSTSDQTPAAATQSPLNPTQPIYTSTVQASTSTQPELPVATLSVQSAIPARISSSGPAPAAMSQRQVIPIWEALNEGPSTSDVQHSAISLLSPESTPARWQPDAEATYCPICFSQFSIFVRKHHCRKCGRVVCNSCSPHRIVIPYQYIVRPPGQTGPQWTANDLSPIIHGGERVRLCNPCVPDPNTTPPLPTPQPPNQMSPRTHHRSYSGAGSPRVYSSNSAGVEGSRSRSATLTTPQRDNMPARAYQSYGSSYQPSSTVGSSQRYQSRIDGSGSSTASSPHYHRRSLPPPPPLAEEDECPICHLELPSRLLPSFETLRETHITQCIISHSSFRGSPSGGADVSSGPGGNRTGPSRIVRRTGMFPYIATEKDSIDSAECTICLEEFETGEQMARLECLCRFHLHCIRAWFQKHPGRCPVHQHDSFGY